MSGTIDMIQSNLTMDQLKESLKTVHERPQLHSLLLKYTGEKGMSTDELGAKAAIARSTINKIVSGKMLPKQDPLLRIAFALNLSAEQAQELLKAGLCTSLSASKPRDVAIILGLNNHVTLNEMDDILTQEGMKPLFSADARLSDFLAPFMGNLSLSDLLQKAKVKISGLSGLQNSSLDTLDAYPDNLTRDDLLRIGFVLHLSASNMQSLLRIAKCTRLNQNDPNDALWLRALDADMTYEEAIAHIRGQIKRILFICHGNICRSPMAEMVMKELVRRENLADHFTIASCATSTEEIGNPIYPPAREELIRRNIPCDRRRARQLTRHDYKAYDLLLCMDDRNVKNTLRIVGEDRDGKVHKLLEYAGRSGDVADPWYSDRFDIAYDDIFAGCQGLLHSILNEQV